MRRARGRTRPRRRSACSSGGTATSSSWRLVLIGLTERAEQYVERGYTPLKSARGYASRFRRYGMPFAPEPRARVVGTGRACRAVVAARVLEPGSEWAVFRALQFAWFTTTRLLDEDDAIREAIDGVSGIDAEAVVAVLDREDVVEAYERDRAEARTAAGSPTEFQGKSAATDGPVRYTAPSVIFELRRGDGSRAAASSPSRRTTFSSRTSTPRFDASNLRRRPSPCSSASPPG